MNIGIPRERRTFEFRVGMTPAGVQLLTSAGHRCYVEHDAGIGAGFNDQEYEAAGARIVYSGHEAFGRGDLLLKVARPTYEELEWVRPNTIIAGLLHLAATRQDKVNLLKEKEITAISYELIRTREGDVPVRRPLSQIGGSLVAQISARLLQNDAGGKGILLGGIASVPPAEVVVIGAGIFGTYATRSFLRIGAHVTVLDVSMQALSRIYDMFPGIVTLPAYPNNIARACAYADVVAASILVPGGRPPIIINREMVRGMKPRSLLMDVSIDEGGCVETSRLTTHETPTFIDEGVTHYCVPNIPSIVARTATYAFVNAALPYIQEIASKGIDQAILDNPDIEYGVALLHGEGRHLPQLPLIEEND